MIRGVEGLISRVDSLLCEFCSGDATAVLTFWLTRVPVLGRSNQFLILRILL